MTDKLMDCIVNPVKCKLLLEIHSQGKTTAKHLADTYNDIPQATLYRHLKKMLSDGILQVVEETQVRGTVEKTYSLAYGINSTMETMLKENSGELYMQYFIQYILGFAKQFQKYCQSPNINIQKDMTGFSLSPLYLSDDELTSLVTDISRIIGAVKNNKPNPERQLRTIGVIVSPAENTDR
ncbi:MAG TPA: helix-turn-helix domain-containing protein [Candidatus Eisenbergiella merdavium]|uniref:Helix-turn-helix domain-containing protein n=1 Tax=Candidatus Eisenbergiella merdavium TaxID=2838551 RepID=A0A9D2NFS0_9FIRM|nr:helix-turn-helix domain-containing protein [Candidatus Eisenbergiella merdavium]